MNTPNYKTYSFADLKALKNELTLRLNDPLQVLKYEEYRTMAISTNREIDKRLDALISPRKEKASTALSKKDEGVFIQMFNDATGHKHRFMDDKAKRQLVALYDKHTVTHHDMEKAIKSAFKDMTERETVKHLTPEFITRPSQFSKYLNMKDTAPKPAFIQA